MASFTCQVFKIFLCFNMYLHLIHFSWPNNVPLHGYTTFAFIHSLVDEMLFIPLILFIVLSFSVSCWEVLKLPTMIVQFISFCYLFCLLPLFYLHLFSFPTFFWIIVYKILFQLFINYWTQALWIPAPGFFLNSHVLSINYEIK